MNLFVTRPDKVRRQKHRLIAGAALALVWVASPWPPAHATPIVPPLVPDELKVPEGSRAFLEGHGVGTQDYICLPSGAGFKFALFTPQATLFDDQGKQIITHYFSPNPAEGGVVRPTWQHSHDTSTVWAVATPETTSTDPEFVAPGAVPWLRLEVMGSQEGPIGSDKLAPTTFIQRVNTSGGLAPRTGCDSPEDVGRQVFAPYTADYIFYTGGEDDEDSGN